jgi:NADH dehydrogenase [ubiquinone] 1 alpha subcomplex assembly factor 1
MARNRLSPSGSPRRSVLAAATRRALGALVVAAALAPGTTGGETGEEMAVIVDFSSEEDCWSSIDDVVMGGVSSSRMTVANGVAAFSGVVSFDNSGGFASVRSRPLDLDLSAYDGLVLRVRGDGKRYGFRIRTTAAFDGVSYQGELAPPAGEWTDVELPFRDFVPVFRGRGVPDHPPLDRTRITTFGLMISRQEGPFRLEVASIRAVKAGDGNEPPL